MTDTYDQIAEDSYDRYINNAKLDNRILRSYFDRCFDDALAFSGHYPAYGCLECTLQSTGILYLGEKSKKCDDCGSESVFQLATFQGRASVYGKVFASAVQVLFQNHFNLNLRPTPHNTKTHDLEASTRIAIEAKGSARNIKLPDGKTITIDRPGLLRSDTEKKAEANGRNYKRFNPNSKFYVVTNALPPRLRGIRSSDIDGYFDLTKADRVEALMREIRDQMDDE